MTARPFRQFRKFTVDRTELTRARARPTQEYFWYMEQQDPDPAAYYSPAGIVIHGPLDVDVLRRALRMLFVDHSIFRTGYVEVDGTLQQVVVDADARTELEVIERPLPESAWDAELGGSVDELIGRGFDLPNGHVLWSRLIQVAPERHLLVFLAHHIAGDAASFAAIVPWLFAQYERLRTGVALPPPPLQYIDFSESLERWRTTADGEAAAQYWTEKLRGAPAVHIPCDLPRDEVDRTRDATPFGISTSTMHRPVYYDLPEAVRAAVARVCTEDNVTTYVVYLAALVWLLHRETGQTDISIETSFNLRHAHKAFEPIQGPTSMWTVLRTDVAGCNTLREAIRRARIVVGESQENGPIFDYYRAVPHGLRRAIFNYVPVPKAAPTVEAAPGITIVTKRLPFARWKRPWDLHLTLVDAPAQTTLVWTGNEGLFTRDALVGLFDRFSALLRDL